MESEFYWPPQGRWAKLKVTSIPVGLFGAMRKVQTFEMKPNFYIQPLAVHRDGMFVPCGPTPAVVSFVAEPGRPTAM